MRASSEPPDQQKPSHFTGHYLELPRREAGPALEAREGRTPSRASQPGGRKGDVWINNKYGDLFSVTGAYEKAMAANGK